MLTELKAVADSRPQPEVCPAAPPLLSAARFATVVASAPLVAIDLIVEDERGEVLLGLRNNPPAKGYWFVPGGRVRKDEPLADAFCRIALDEIDCAPSIARLDRSDFVGVFEHFYDVDFMGKAGATTHYVVLAYRFRVERSQLKPRNEQHNHYMWLTPDEIAQHPLVHANVHAYF